MRLSLPQPPPPPSSWSAISSLLRISSPFHPEKFSAKISALHRAFRVVRWVSYLAWMDFFDGNQVIRCWLAVSSFFVQCDAMYTEVITGSSWQSEIKCWNGFSFCIFFFFFPLPSQKTVVLDCSVKITLYRLLTSACSIRNMTDVVDNRRNSTPP